MISGAEALRIGRPLESVSSWAAEIVVVLNTEVTDATEAICREHGARVIRESWKGHIAQKNSAAAKATQPWILAIDADEVVTPELQAEIRRTLSNPGTCEPYAAFSVPRLSCYAGRWIRHGDWYPDRKVRLWRRGTAQWGGEDPHDRLDVTGAVGRLRGDLEHYSYDSLSHHLSKVQTYSDIFVREAQARNRGARLFDLVVRPPWRFIRGYFLRAGFLDGWQGFVIAWMSALLTFLKYAKLREASARRSTPQESSSR
jgi:glycosyltransferase involved in cell wall biosynthesis